MESDELSGLLDAAYPLCRHCGGLLHDAGVTERLELVCWTCGQRAYVFPEP